MTFERSGGVPMGEPLPQPGVVQERDAVPTAGTEVPPALRLQILAAEHWSLLATRSMVWNEIFARAGTFLSALAGAIVALALVGQGSGFGSTFALFGIVVLPVVLFVGLGTYLRMGVSNGYDAMCVIGMNRIRAAYLELAPDLERYFVTSAHDDERGIAISMGLGVGAVSPVVHFLSATPVVIVAINSVLAGAIVGLVLAQLGVPAPAALLGSIIGFAALAWLQSIAASRQVRRAMAGHEPMFPTSPG